MNSKEMCRTCLGLNEKMMPLFDEKAAVTCVGYSITIVDLLKKNCEILISPDDSYPQQICLKCLEEVQRAFYFQLKCKKSDTKLRQFGINFDENRNKTDSPQTEQFSSISNHNDNQELQETSASNWNKEEQSTIVKDELNISDVEEIKDSENCSSDHDSICASGPVASAMKHSSMENHVNAVISNEESGSNTCNGSDCSENVETHPTNSDEVKLNGKRVFKCTVCTRICDSNARLKEHMGVHTKVKPYTCEICSRNFRRKDMLDNHLISHSDDRPHECSICLKKFKRKDTLTKHMKIYHINDEVVLFSCETKSEAECTEKSGYKCEICSKCFDQKRNLYQHKRVHSEVKRFECDLCLKRFAWKKCLTTHISTHNNERPFKCLICPATFKQKQNLQKHTTDLHSAKRDIGDENSDDDAGDKDERPYKCVSCQVSFKLMAGLTKHKKKFHENLEEESD